jgi:hypothetical protein
MADNVTITPGTGKTVLADEVTDGTLGTGVAQYVKILDGTLNSTNKLVIGSNGALAVATVAPTASVVTAVTSYDDERDDAAGREHVPRLGLYIYNDSTAILYVKLGTGRNPDRLDDPDRCRRVL